MKLITGILMRPTWKHFTLAALFWTAVCPSLFAQYQFAPSATERQGDLADAPSATQRASISIDAEQPGFTALTGSRPLSNQHAPPERHSEVRFASAPYESDILSARPVRYLLGLGIGAYGFLHRGSFSPSCDCEFSEEDGIRFMFGGEFRVRYPKLGIAYGVFVSYYDASATFTREDVRRSLVVGDWDDVDVRYRSTSDVVLRWISVTPEFLWYLPRSEFFLSAGAEFGIPLEARYDHVENILTSDITYHDGSTENLLLAEQDIPGGAGLRIALAGAIGYDFYFTPMVGVTPRVGLTLPLTSVSSADEGWSVLTAHALLMLNLRL